MESSVLYGGKWGQWGQRRVYRVESSPHNLFVSVGTLGAFIAVRARATELSPRVQTGKSTVGTHQNALFTGLSPASPMSPRELTVEEQAWAHS
jgi:hypothetical protein